MGTFLGVPIITTILYWGLYWGSPILGNYHVSSLKEEIRHLHIELAGSRA